MIVRSFSAINRRNGQEKRWLLRLRPRLRAITFLGEPVGVWVFWWFYRLRRVLLRGYCLCANRKIGLYDRGGEPAVNEVMIHFLAPALSIDHLSWGQLSLFGQFSLVFSDSIRHLL